MVDFDHLYIESNVLGLRTTWFSCFNLFLKRPKRIDNYELTQENIILNHNEDINFNTIKDTTGIKGKKEGSLSLNKSPGNLFLIKY